MTDYLRQHVFADEKPGRCACGHPAGSERHFNTPGAQLTRIRAACSRIYRQQVGVFTCTHLSEMLYIKAKAVASPTHIAVREQLSKPTAGKAVDRLVAYGYLARTGRRGDYRSFEAIVTPNGAKALDKALVAAEQRAATLTEEQLKVLEAAAEIMESIAADAPGVPPWTQHERIFVDVDPAILDR